MIADLTYYKLLEIEPDADEKEIRSSYKKLSTKYHPDKNSNLPVEKKQETTEKYKKIQIAYKVLSDPDKRFLYDKYGIDEKTGKLNGEKFTEMYDSGYLSGQRKKNKKQKFKIRDVKTNVIMSLDQCYKGYDARVTYTRFDIKNKSSTTEDIMCHACNGIGYHEILDNRDYILKKLRKKCDVCDGSCVDKNYIILRGVTKTVKIPAGIYEWRCVIVKGEGNEIPSTNGARTDLKIIIKELRKHKVLQTNKSAYYNKGHLEFFRGIGEKIYNLRVKLDITQLQLTCGSVIFFNHVNKSLVNIYIPPDITSRVLKVPGLGLPVWDGNKGEYGDLIIRLVTIPSLKKLDDSKRSEIWKLSTGRKLEMPKKDTLVAKDFDELDDDDENALALKMYLNANINWDDSDADAEPPDCKQM